MNTITQQELDALCLNGRAIDMQGGYPCVVLHPDGTITKIWAIKKRLISSNTLSSYSQRFVNNAAKLKKRAVTVPEILSHAAVKGTHIKIVTYRSLPGKSIRDLLEDTPDQVNVHSLCQYIHTLHEKGIFFRSIHLGNIIQLPSGDYGLIDFTDVAYAARPLPLTRRAANLAFPLRYRDDIQRMEDVGLPNIRDTYLDILQPNTVEKTRFIHTLNHYMKR